MDWGDIGGNIPVIVTVIGLIVLQFFLRRRRPPETSPWEIAQNLLAEVGHNLKIAEAFTFHWQARKFVIASWQRNKNKLDFLEQSLQGFITDAFIMAQDFNQQIAAARKHKSASYMASVNVEKLKGLLTKSEQGLEQWLTSEGGTTEPSSEVAGVFDDWGGRG